MTLKVKFKEGTANRGVFTPALEHVIVSQGMYQVDAKLIVVFAFFNL